MDHVDVKGLRIGYERAGAGPPLVLLHGFVGDGRATWSGQLEDLSDEFTVIAWDTPGTGGSSDPPEWFRSPGFADCLAGFIDALGLVRPHLVGLSFGGVVALELFRRHPEIPRTLVLAGAYAGWAGSMSPQRAEERLRFCLRAAELSPREFVDAMLPSMFCDAETARVAKFVGSMPTSMCPRCCSTGTGTYGPPSRSRKPFTPPFPDHVWSFCPVSVMSAASRRRSSSTARSATSSGPLRTAMPTEHDPSSPRFSWKRSSPLPMDPYLAPVS
jgi:pimeloyl-ACP methyl ester carboxylesterase